MSRSLSVNLVNCSMYHTGGKVIVGHSWCAKQVLATATYHQCNFFVAAIIITRSRIRILILIVLYVGIEFAVIFAAIFYTSTILYTVGRSTFSTSKFLRFIYTSRAIFDYLL